MSVMSMTPSFQTLAPLQFGAKKSERAFGYSTPYLREKVEGFETQMKQPQRSWYGEGCGCEGHVDYSEILQDIGIDPDQGFEVGSKEPGANVAFYANVKAKDAEMGMAMMAYEEPEATDLFTVGDHVKDFGKALEWYQSADSKLGQWATSKYANRNKVNMLAACANMGRALMEFAAAHTSTLAEEVKSDAKLKATMAALMAQTGKFIGQDTAKPITHPDAVNSIPLTL